MNELMLLVDIPETAGNAFRTMLEKESRVITHYDYDPDNPASNRKPADVDTDSLSPVKNKINVICDHLNYRKYRRNVAQSNVLSILRNPIERLISEYQHHVRHNRQYRSFKQFASSPEKIDTQSKIFAEFDELNKGLIGLTSHFEEYLILVNKRLGLEMKCSAFNQTPKFDLENIPDISLSEINTAFELNRQEILFFMRAVEAFRESLSAEGMSTSPRDDAQFDCRIHENTRVMGWVSRGNRECLFVELSVNGEPRAITSLDRERKQIAAKGLSESSKCSFNYPLKLLGAGPGDSLGVRILGNSRFYKELFVPIQAKIYTDEPLNEKAPQHSALPQTTPLTAAPLRNLDAWREEGVMVCHARGDSPQLILELRNPAVGWRAGWSTLNFKFQGATSCKARVQVDYGFGFESDLVLKQKINATSEIRIPLYLPKGTRKLSLELLDCGRKFRLSEFRLVHENSANLEMPDAQQLDFCNRLQSLDGINFTLSPANQVSLLDAEMNVWLSHGEDPYFQLESHRYPILAPGWYQADLLMQTKQSGYLARYYLDTGSGYSATENLPMKGRSGQRVRRIFKVDKAVHHLRFDPTESAGDLKIESLNIIPIREERAKLRMLQQLITTDPEFVVTSPEQVWSTLEDEAARNDSSPLQWLIERYILSFDARPANVIYKDWIETVEADSLPDADTVKNTLASMPLKPLISIVMPVYNTPETYLRECIDSVIAQSYQNWELCIADDNSPKPHVRRILEEYAARDQRIRVIYREQNGHISRASNSALEIASGDYVALLDHDDVLPKHALYFIALAINEHPDAQILYSDEDKIDANGQRFEPHFKSDWNPDLFYSNNYVSHLGVYRHELLQRIGGFRTGVEGSQDQDLLLRCLPHVESGQIFHIPRVLYHWRSIEGSTALNSGEKSYTTDAGIKALRDYFAENGPAGVQVSAALVPNTYRVKWPIAAPEPLVSLLIPTRDKKVLTEVAVRSILEKTTYPNYEIIILDNGSIEPETLEWFDTIQKEDSRVSVLRYDHPFNYSAINNFGVAHARGSIIGLINNDIEVISPEWLVEMVSYACRKEIGCVGSKLYYGNDTLQHGGVILGIGGVANHSHKHAPRESPGYFGRLMLVQNLSAVTAACLIIRKEIYEAVGGLDEENLKVAFNDVDLCLKVRAAGYLNLWTPYAELYHHESISRGSEDTPEKQERFLKENEYMYSKWGEALKLDPYYNPNLIKDREDFSIGL